MLIINDVHFQYDDKGVLFHFCLDVETGAIIGIVGKSGSGKSTLLDLVAGFQKPLKGRIEWDENNIVSLPPEARPVTILFQSNNLFEHLTALENVALGVDPSFKMTDTVKSKALGALSDVGLSGFEYKKTQFLSGGQKQRVALARSLARAQPILLLDEPFSGLDDQTKSECLLLVQTLAKTHGTIVLMVTHDLSDCEAIADKTYEVTTQNGVSQLTEITH